MLALGVVVAFFFALSGMVFAAWQGLATGSGQAHASPDLRAPGVAASVIATSGGSAGVIAQGATYFIYANLTDAGTPPSGVETATADVSAITTGATAVALPPCTTSGTVSGTTYGYRSAAQVADSPLANGTYTYAINVTDHVGNAATVGGFSVVVNNDTTAPALTALQMFDTDANGKIDQVTATFSETLASYTAGTTPWTFANVPSAGSLGSVSVTGSVATLTITEGSGAATTAAGTFTVALAAHPDAIRDAAGNQSSFAATAPADKAAPRLSSALGWASGNGHRDVITGTTTENNGTITVRVYAGNAATGTPVRTYTLSNPPASWSITTGNNDLSTGSIYTAQATHVDGSSNTSNQPTVTFTAS
jgi:hypothetical protein